MKKKVFVSRGCLVIAAVLTGCGGGGGSSLPPVDPDTVLNGYVMDGPLVGVKVCLDSNSNWVCDVSEPSATTTAKGAFSLSIAPLKYQETYTKQIIAEVGPDALDEASGMTLHAAGQGGYVLASWGGPRPILSPINTVLALEQLSTGYTPPLDTFKVGELLEKSGFSKTSENYFDADAPLTLEERVLAKKTGRLLATLLSAAATKLKTDAASVYAADTSQLGARVAELVLQALRNSQPSSANESESEALQRMQSALSAIAVTASTEQFNRKALSEMAPDAALSLLGQGLVDAGALGSSPRYLLQYKVAATTGVMSSSRYRYIGGVWSQDAAYAGAGSSGYHVISQSDQGAAFRKISTTSPALVKEGLVLKERFSDGANTQSNELIVLSRSLSGLSFDALPELTSFTGSFAQGEQVYWLRRKATANQYLFDSVATFFTTLSQFKNSPQTCYEGICWSITEPAVSNVETGAGRMTFKTTSSGGSLVLGEGRFVEDTVAGVNVLRMTSIPIEVQNRSQMWNAKDGRYLSFADIDGKLWTGKYMLGGTVWYSNNGLTKAGVNGVLTSAQLNAFGQ